MKERESVRILQECIDLQRKKAHDYQNPNSTVKQADHYRRGVDTIHDMIHQKLLRAQSLIESGSKPNNESLEDTYKDMINYCSFAVAWLRRGIDGQSLKRDEFNNPYPVELHEHPDVTEVIYDQSGPYPDIDIPSIAAPTLVPAESKMSVEQILADEEDNVNRITKGSTASKMESLENTIEKVKNASHK